MSYFNSSNNKDNITGTYSNKLVSRTNEGDDDLLESFTWTKKLEKEGLTNYDRKTQEDIIRKKRDELNSELQRVKKRRVEREIEKQKREEEMNVMKHLKEDYDFEYWKSQEDEFHMNQARLRSKLRILHRRAKPIDMLAAYINCDGDNSQLHIDQPIDLINSISLDDCIDLKEDIKVFRQIEKDAHSDFWNDINVILDVRMKILRKESNPDYTASVDNGSVNSDGRQVIHSVAREDVANILKGKTSNQLAAIAFQVETKLSDSGTNIDVAFWECLREELKVYLANARLKELHDEQMKKFTVNKNEQHHQETNSDVLSNSFMKPLSEDQNADEPSIEVAKDAYIKGGYSPKLMSFKEIDKQLWRDSEEDWKNLLQHRDRVQTERMIIEDKVSRKLYEAEKNRKMEDDEEEFNQMIALPKQEHQWHQKYKPRKPKFFNKVHTGYEWNKYNQTHYDSDNPPPKIIQGYKFNVTLNLFLSFAKPISNRLQ